jgi:hypothetical protein
MVTRAIRWAVFLLSVPMVAAAQEGDFGISVPITLSAGFSASPATAGARGMLYPTLKLGSHWFAYAAVQVRRTPYFYSDTTHTFGVNAVQAFVGYSLRKGKAALVFKAGQLTTAFGSYPLRYDDAQNPLIDQPITYVARLPLQYKSGWEQKSEALTPVTVYGMPAAEADASIGRIDARLQLSGGSPSYPEGWSGIRQYQQWVFGAGYTIRQGFRIGASAFCGPFLDSDDVPSSPRNFPAAGVGADLQWARGRWSVNAEWQNFHFDLPGQPVAFTAAYAEAKAIVSPRLYLATRIGRLTAKSPLTSVETAAGVWLNRHQLLKVGYEWAENTARDGTFGVQLVTSFEALDRSFR